MASVQVDRYVARYRDGYYVVVDSASGEVVPAPLEHYKRHLDGYLWDYAAAGEAQRLNELLGEDWPGLERWIGTSHAFDLLDDAVLGCLQDSTVMELLEDYGIGWTQESRRRFARLLDAEPRRP